MFTYVKVSHRELNLNYSWLLMITNMEELLVYQEKVDIPRNATAMTDILQRDTNEACGKWNWHHTTQMSAIADSVAEKVGINNLDALSKISSQSLMTKIRLLNEDKVILINHKGGYFYLTDDYEITQTVTKETIGFPDYTEKDIDVFQWRNGTHWYAKIAHFDVFDENHDVKWDTFKEAKEAALRYLKTLK
jgi:hypothetical protein